MKRITLHPILFSVYFVLALWVNNIQEIAFEQIIRSLIVEIVFGLLLWLGATFIWRHSVKSAVMVSALVILFFAYGHVYDTIRVWSFDLARHRYLLPVFVVSSVVWAWLLHKTKDPAPLNNYFNVFGLVLVLISAYNIGRYWISYISTQSRSETPVANSPVGDNSSPDVYYIIVDGYGRQDVLADYYGYDNSEFINYLEGKGFYVAKESTSNYRRTVLSLTSSLNMAYLQDLFPDLDPTSKDFTALYDSLKHSAVRQLLAEQGYQLLTYGNGIKTTIQDAELLFVPDETLVKERALDLNGFEGLLIQMSAARLWVDWQVKQGEENPLRLIEVEAPYNRQRENILFGIETLTNAPEVNGNNFVFIHLVAPHPPFVFGPNGEFIKHDRLFTIADGPFSQGSRQDYVRGYTDQLTYLNSQLITAIDSILENSDPEPIIIIQGDHGPKGFTDEGMDTSDFTENFGILNAYYFPGREYGQLYQSISPVNSFRVVLNEFFGESYPLLEDKIYFSSIARPFDFTLVTSQVR
jgi:hypothetical protein